MRRDEAIQLGNEWVRARFPVVPPVAMAVELTPEAFSLAAEVSERELSSIQPSQIGDWCVFYKCDRDTDALGLPPQLGVKVDGKTGQTEPLFKV